MKAFIGAKATQTQILSSLQKGYSPPTLVQSAQPCSLSSQGPNLLSLKAAPLISARDKILLVPPLHV